ncbi:hypothetical protein BFZC1_20393 [Lysinibacillus fusiformis ZC1]|nr:hypothetical protein BFZC1_20393 [Lysinibacillus fusiformis ZC1]
MLKDIDYNDWAVVEQDINSAPFDKSFPIVKRIYDHISRLIEG